MLERKGWMNFRTSYLKRIIQLSVCVFLVSLNPVSIAEPLKITGPDGQSRQQNRQYGPTTKSDTFWRIAVKMRPNNKVSIYQVMAAIYDANPHAFANANYNSLEAGIILLVPSAEKMLAIPLKIARERAEQDDKNWKKQKTQPKNQAAKPNEKPKPQTIEQQIAEIKTEPESPQKINQLALLLEEEENKVISLTDQLSRTQDELTIAKDDLQALKNKLAELSDKVDVLEGTLIETRQLNATLKAENKVLQDTLALEREEEPTDIWRSLLDNPLMLIAIAIVPALLIILLIFLIWRRGQPSAEENLTEEKQVEPEQAAEVVEEIQPREIDLEPAVEEENLDEVFEEMAVQLDEVEVESGTDNLTAPEEAEEEGKETDLDDLWAEALDEQIEGNEISADAEELLNQLDETSAETSDDVSSGDDSDELTESVDFDSQTDSESLKETAEEKTAEVSEFFEESISELSAAELETIDEIEGLSTDNVNDSETDTEEIIDSGSVSGSEEVNPDESDKPADTQDTEFDTVFSETDKENNALGVEPEALDTEPDSAEETTQTDSEEVNPDESDKPADTQDTEFDTVSFETDKENNALGVEPEALNTEPESAEETTQTDSEEVNPDESDKPADTQDTEFDTVSFETDKENNALGVEPEALNTEPESAEETTQTDSEEVNPDESDKPADTQDTEFDTVSFETDKENNALGVEPEALNTEPESAEETTQTDSEEVNPDESDKPADTQDTEFDTVFFETDKENNALGVEPEALDTEPDSAEETTETDSEEVNLDLTSEQGAESPEADSENDTLDFHPASSEETTGSDPDGDHLKLPPEQTQELSEITAEDDSLDFEPTAFEENIEADVKENELDLISEESAESPEVDADDSLEFESVDFQEDIGEDQDDNTELVESGSDDAQNSDELSDIPYEPVIESSENDSEVSLTCDVEEQQESDLSAVPEITEPTAGFDDDVVAEDIEPQAEREPADDLDALMAEFDVDLPSQLHSGSLADPELSESSDDLNKSQLKSFQTQIPSAEQAQGDALENGVTDFNSGNGISPRVQSESDLSVNSLNNELTRSPQAAAGDSSMPDLDFEVDLNDDELFDSFARVSDEMKHTEALLASDMADIGDLKTDDDSKASSFEGDNMTVDEALAALDNEIDTDIKAEKVSDDDLSSFQKENGYIDIDKLLNESSEDSSDADPYQDVDVNFGESSDLNSLFESNPMTDVDDAENSVNAKLDLARAYIEIDDKDSAKALLEEIQVDGNDRQQSEASELLNSIS